MCLQKLFKLCSALHFFGCLRYVTCFIRICSSYMHAISLVLECANVTYNAHCLHFLYYCVFLSLFLFLSCFVFTSLKQISCFFLWLNEILHQLNMYATSVVRHLSRIVSCVKLIFQFLCIFMRERRILAIAVLSVRPSVCLSVTRVDQTKTVRARITKSLASSAWKTLVSGTVKLFHKFEGSHLKRGC